MNARWLWLCALPIAAVGVDLYLGQKSQITTLRRDLVALDQEVRELQSAPALSSASRTIEVPMRARHPIEEMPSAVPGPTPAPKRSAGASNATTWEDEYRASQTAVEVAFSSQTVDHAWASQARRDLSRQLGPLLPQTASVRDAECRASICRVEIRQQESGLSPRFAEAFTAGSDRVWGGPWMAEPAQANSDGTYDVVLYLGREGTSLPSVD
jgi:hypothetical protein